MYKTNKQQEYNILYSTGDYSHYFSVTVDSIQSIPISNHCAIHLKLMQNCKSTKSKLKEKIKKNPSAHTDLSIQLLIRFNKAT